MTGLLRRAVDGALTIGAILGVVTLLVVAIGALFGVRPIFFRSGSMAPTIDTGALALARSVPAAELRVGDVVSVQTSAGIRVTHRILRAESTADGVVLGLKGDANRVADPESYRVHSTYRVFWHVPWVGYAVGAMLSPIGLFALGVAVLGLLILATGGRRSGTPPGGRRARRTPQRRHRARRAGATAVAMMAVFAGPASAAPWTDAVPVGGTVLTADVVPASASFNCGGLGLFSVRFAWSAVAGATNYTLHYGSGGSQTVVTTSTNKTITSVISGGTAWVVANHNYGFTTWSSVASNTRTYTVAVVSLCG